MVKQSFHKAKAGLTKIRRIALVGGFADYAQYSNHPDAKFVEMTNEYLTKSGIAVDDAPEIDVINFIDGRNFLNEEKEYDAVYIAFIPQGINLSHTRMEFRTFSKRAFDGSNGNRKREMSRNTIDIDNSPANWMKRILQSKAKVIAARSGFIEIDLNYLQKAPNYNVFSTLLTPERNASLDHRSASDFGREKVRQLYGQDVDVPFQWLAVAAKPAYLWSIQSALRGANTTLSREALDVIGQRNFAPIPIP